MYLLHSCLLFIPCPLVYFFTEVKVPTEFFVGVAEAYGENLDALVSVCVDICTLCVYSGCGAVMKSGDIIECTISLVPRRFYLMKFFIYLSLNFTS